MRRVLNTTHDIKNSEEQLAAKSNEPSHLGTTQNETWTDQKHETLLIIVQVSIPKSVRILSQTR